MRAITRPRAGDTCRPCCLAYLRACDRAMAMACLRLVTSGPFLEPECNVPCLNSCSVFSILALSIA